MYYITQDITACLDSLILWLLRKFRLVERKEEK